MSKLAKWQRQLLIILESRLDPEDPGSNTDDEIKTILREHSFFGSILRELKKLSGPIPDRISTNYNDNWVANIRRRRRIAKATMEGGRSDEKEPIKQGKEGVV